MSTQIDKVLFANVLDIQTGLVSDCFTYGVFEESDVQNLWHVDGTIEKKAIKHWYLVTEWFGQKLADQGIPVLFNEYGVWWGRLSDEPLLDTDSLDLSKIK